MSSSRERGIDAVAEREQLWRDSEPAIASALEQVDWDEILTAPGAPAAHCLLTHRLKSRRLSGWSRAHGGITCPHCPDAGAGGGRPEHFMWACPAAQRLWTALQSKWDTLRSDSRRGSEAELLRAVFQLRLETMPDRLWEHPEVRRLPAPTASDTSATHQALQAIWRLQVMATFHTLWRWRTAADVPDELWTPQQAAAYHEACLQATLVNPRWPKTRDSAASCHTAAMIAVLSQAQRVRELQPASVDSTHPPQYLLFFDGGSRGNPGPGGSGAVIVRVSHQATRASVIWSAAMSAASRTTTNNQAEYAGVIHGLRAARASSWTPLEVVGDSQLILRQLRDYRPPRNERLREDYAIARRLADTLGIRRWNHHLRSFNKMADAAANAAMDSRASSQVTHPTTRAQHAQLERHLSTDFAHWQANYFARL